MIDHANMAMDYYRNHMQAVLDEMGPVLDALDEQEWDEHNEVKKLKDKWKELRQELDQLKKELKDLKNNRDEQIRRAIEAKQKEVDEVGKKV